MENIYRTDPVDVTKGVHQFYSSAALPDVELQHVRYTQHNHHHHQQQQQQHHEAYTFQVMTRDDEHPLEGAPDVFCYVYEKVSTNPEP